MKHDNEFLCLEDVSETQYYPPISLCIYWVCLLNTILLFFCLDFVVKETITASFVFQVVSTLSELLKLNYRNKTLKLSILATLGEFLHLISSQVVFTYDKIWMF